MLDLDLDLLLPVLCRPLQRGSLPQQEEGEGQQGPLRGGSLLGQEGEGQRQ